MTRLLRWNRLLARAYRLACWAGLAALIGTALLLGADAAWPGLLDKAGADEGLGAVAIALIIALFVLAVPAALAVCSAGYLVSSLASGEEWSPQDLAWGGVAVAVCAIGLTFAVGSAQCTPALAAAAATAASTLSTAPDPAATAACWTQVRWFAVDQAMQGALGDIPDIWEWGFSSIELEQLTDWNRFQTLQFRMLCAAVLVGALAAALSRPLGRLAASRAALRWHRGTSAAFGWAVRAAGVSVAAWLVVIALDVWWAPGWLASIEHAGGTVAAVVHGVLGIALLLIPAALPLFTGAFLGSSLLVGHRIGKAELAGAALAMLLCVAGMMHAVDSSACSGPDATANDSCGAAVGGFAVDQFYRGAFADVFDVYDLKLGAIATDKLSFLDRVLVLNVRMLSAVVVVGLIAWLMRRRAAHEVDDFAPTQPDESEFSGFPATQILIDERLVPKPRSGLAGRRRS